MGTAVCALTYIPGKEVHTPPRGARFYVCCRTDMMTSNLYVSLVADDKKAAIMIEPINRSPLVIRFMDTKPRILMEITNTTAKILKSVEILTVFLKDEQGSSAPSRAHIRFDPIKSVQPNEKAVVSHRTWINGSPARDAQDQIGRLQVVVGAVKPYVLDISWEDVDGKTQFQRIAVGH